MSSFEQCVPGMRLSHAILIEGDGDKLPFARALAKTVLCADGKDKPCEICRDCVKIEKNIHPDVILYSGGDKARSFHIDAVRNVRREAYICPNEAAGKVFILDNVHNMTVQAQNALLKIIEEPPTDVTFILTCENKSAILETVLSLVGVITLDREIEPQEADIGIMKKANQVLALLLSGGELEILAAFSQYERDRSGLSIFLRALRKAVSDELINSAKASGARGRADYPRFLKAIEIIDDMETANAQNVGGLVLVNIFCARFFADLHF